METLNNTILIIEDDLGLNELICEKISKSGYQTKCTFSVSEAMHWLKANNPLLMMVDYSLADHTAKEFINTIKSENIPLPPFIVATGHGNERVAVEMMKLGARDYIIKDTNLLDLLPTIIGRVVKEIENENKLKLAENALHESEMKFKFLFAENPQPMFVYDINTYAILEVNQTALNFYGYTKEESLKMTIKELHPSEDIQSFLKMMDETRKGNKTDGITKHIKKNGEIIFVEIFSSSATNWGENARLALVVDITDRKKAEEALIKKINDIEYMNKFMVNREVRMGEMKKEVNEMCLRVGEEKRYL